MLGKIVSEIIRISDFIGVIRLRVIVIGDMIA